MPNHCTNNLSLEGPIGDLQMIRQLLLNAEMEVTFQRFVPMPAVIRKTGSGFSKFETEDGETIEVKSWYDDGSERRPFTEDEKAELAEIGHENWYDWACQHWGTKWDAYSSESGGRPFSYTFDTAWGPPNPVLAAITAKYPNVTLKNQWHEEGGDHGVDEWVNGELVQ